MLGGVPCRHYGLLSVDPRLHRPLTWPSLRTRIKNRSKGDTQDGSVRPGHVRDAQFFIESYSFSVYGFAAYDTITF